MTVLPSDYEEDEEQRYQGGQWPAQPAPVVQQSERHSPEFASCMTWVVPQVGQGQPVQILQRQPQRYKAKFTITNAGTLMVFNSKLDPLTGATPQGFSVSAVGALNMPDWESQQPLYVICTGTGGSISVVDETYAVR